MCALQELRWKWYRGEMLSKETILLTLIDLLGVGLQVTGSKLIGLVLILLSSCGLWWLILSWLSDKGEVYPALSSTI